MRIIDCGKASKVTMGQPTGIFWEVGGAPLNKTNQNLCPPGSPGKPFCP